MPGSMIVEKDEEAEQLLQVVFSTSMEIETAKQSHLWKISGRIGGEAAKVLRKNSRIRNKLQQSIGKTGHPKKGAR